MKFSVPFFPDNRGQDARQISKIGLKNGMVGMYDSRYHLSNIVIRRIILDFALRTFFKMASKPRSLCADYSIAFCTFALVFHHFQF